MGEYSAGKVGNVYETSEVAKWEKCMSGMR